MKHNRSLFLEKTPMDMSGMNRVLIVMMRHHGDVLLATPVFKALKRQFPQLEVDALLYSYSTDLLAHHPAVDNIYAVDRHWKDAGFVTLMRGELALLKSLRARQYDGIIVLTDQWRNALLSRLLRPKFSITSEFAKRQQRFWRKSFSRHYPVPPNRPKVESNLDALRGLGLAITDQDKLVGLHIPEDSRREASAKLQALSMTEQPLVVLHPTSRGLFKCWSIEQYAELVSELQRAEIPVLITAAPDKKELALVAAIVARLEQAPLSLAGELSLLQLAAVLDRAVCVICVDSVPMHMAAALATPLVAMFGPSNDKIWAPLNVGSTVLTSDRVCRPCLRHGCGGSGFSECLADIEVVRVYAAVYEKWHAKQELDQCG